MTLTTIVHPAYYQNWIDAVDYVVNWLRIQFTFDIFAWNANVLLPGSCIGSEGVAIIGRIRTG